MRNLKRVLSLALALVMVLGMMVITTSAADFTDAEEITYTEAVDVMSALGVIEGYNGAFNPTGKLNRAGAAKLIAFMTMGAEADDYLAGSAAPFSDVAADHWAAKYVAYCSNLKIIDGNGDGTFNPDGNISIVGFAKLVLGAIEAEGTFTGAGWEENVKKAVAKVPTMAATKIKITNADITREEAAALMLAGLKAGEAYSNGYYYDGMVDELGYADSYSEIYIMASTLVQNFDAANIKKHAGTRDSLLEEVYGFTCDRTADAFGRPATLYSNNETDPAKLVELWFVDTAVKSYVGEVKGGTVWTDLGSPKAAQTYSIYVDGAKLGNKSVTLTTTSIAKDSKANAVLASVSDVAVAQTGAGVATEIYAAGENKWTIVVVNTYADTVDKVTPAKGEAKAYITLKTSGKTFETEAFAEKDAVLYTMANGVVKSVVKNETTVKGTPTKNAAGVYTIGDATYAVSFKGSVNIELAKEGEWYVDAYGNLIANVGPAAPAGKPVVYVVNYYSKTENTVDSMTGQAGAPKTTYWALCVNTAGEIVTYQMASEPYSLDQAGGVVAARDVMAEVTVEYNATLKANVATFSTLSAQKTTAETKATDIKIDGNYYEDVKYIYVSGEMDKAKVEVKEGAQAVASGTTKWYEKKQVGQTSNYTASYVFVDGAYAAADVTVEGVVFANEANNSNVQVVYTDKDEQTQTGYEHTVYIDGVKTTVVTTSATKLVGFQTLTEVVEGVYAASADNSANLKAATDVTNMFNGLLTTADVTDKAVAGAALVDVSGDQDVTDDATKLTTEYDVALVLSADGKTIVTIYITDYTKAQA